MDISALRAKDIMRTDVIKVSTGTRIGELAKLLEKHRISGVPVVDEANKLTGVVSQTDIIRFYAERGSSQSFAVTKVEEIMTGETFALHEETAVTRIAKTMIGQHMHRVIIVDEDFNLTGVVTSMDLVKLVAELG